MPRASLAFLFLMCIAAPTLAELSHAMPSGGGGDLETEEAHRADPSPPAARAARGKYSGSSSPPTAATSRAGGGAEDDDAMRLRASKWHSFLPGMFR